MDFIGGIDCRLLLTDQGMHVLCTVHCAWIIFISSFSSSEYFQIEFLENLILMKNCFSVFPFLKQSNLIVFDIYFSNITSPSRRTPPHSSAPCCVKTKQSFSDTSNRGRGEEF